MKIQGTIGYAPNPMITKRNQVSYIHFRYPGFVLLWHLTRNSFAFQVPYNMDKRNNPKSKNYSNGDSTNRGSSQDPVAIPKRYRRLELKHSNKDDMDFEPYNKTMFCGLEANLPNNYCNVMLEVSISISFFICLDNLLICRLYITIKCDFTRVVSCCLFM